MEKPEILELLKNKEKELSNKLRYIDGNVCVECLSSNYYYPEEYPYRQYLCHRCSSKYSSPN